MVSKQNLISRFKKEYQCAIKSALISFLMTCVFIVGDYLIGDLQGQTVYHYLFLGGLIVGYISQKQNVFEFFKIGDK